MASRADTLKIAQADVETIGHKIANARRGRVLFNYPEREAEEAIRLLEKTARRLRKVFGINGREAQ